MANKKVLQGDTKKGPGRRRLTITERQRKRKMIAEGVSLNRIPLSEGIRDAWIEKCQRLGVSMRTRASKLIEIDVTKQKSLSDIVATLMGIQKNIREFTAIQKKILALFTRREM